MGRFPAVAVVGDDEGRLGVDVVVGGQVHHEGARSAAALKVEVAEASDPVVLVTAASRGGGLVEEGQRRGQDRHILGSKHGEGARDRSGERSW